MRTTLSRFARRSVVDDALVSASDCRGGHPASTKSSSDTIIRGNRRLDCLPPPKTPSARPRSRLSLEPDESAAPDGSAAPDESTAPGESTINAPSLPEQNTPRTREYPFGLLTPYAVTNAIRTNCPPLGSMLYSSWVNSGEYTKFPRIPDCQKLQHQLQQQSRNLYPSLQVGLGYPRATSPASVHPDAGSATSTATVYPDVGRAIFPQLFGNLPQKVEAISSPTKDDASSKDRFDPTLNGDQMLSHLGRRKHRELNLLLNDGPAPSGIPRRVNSGSRRRHEWISLPTTSHALGTQSRVDHNVHRIAPLHTQGRMDRLLKGIAVGFPIPKGDSAYGYSA
ncbi:hypothetical protein TREMEDRAFT_58989 [Tremella mesenterica DSM 1558]|uniref:uncharacterized protein n=1 Tax=Tremella mesenterica (strain ATCC 24925 / CBS 8224 / DSM 1558 / NBRC 9311 / NRRL Y-6157 / RJB 2259-6 / UBC 559-6) TaxID=578456 RepID=UPI0003F4A645|nr:uncharacterized protein TREMEDRAFT_58989 [Tremella mesenterica DSM 1558]EIW72821.1 hypothetical protein TREMEDRAFT_58989 [Tremella mesenterica DSM 1558]